MAKNIIPETQPAAKKSAKPAGVMQWVSPAKLTMNPQVRTTPADEKSEKEFMESIEQFGVMQPILVRPGPDDTFIVIAGHRRTTAAKVLELHTVPVLVSDVSEEEIKAMQLVENIHRAGLSLYDTANGVWELYNSAGGASVSLTAAMLNKTKSWASKMILLSAPGKAHTVARSLMAQDKLHDIELAYLICQVEEINKDVAQTIGKNIENETRRTVKAWLDQVRAQAKPDADTNSDLAGEEPEGGEGDVLPGVESDSAHAVMVDSQDLDLLALILRDAVVDPVCLDALNRLRTAIGVAKAL